MPAATKAPPRPKLKLRPPSSYWSPARAYTLGPEVAKVCDAVGFRPDPEQRLILDEVFAVGANGLSVAFETDVIAARQNLKTGSLICCGIGWLFVVKAPDIVWSAHEYDTAVAAYVKLVEIIETHDFLQRRVKAMPSAQGKQRIELESGASLRFKARTKTGGRGLDGEKLVLDEAFALDAGHMGTLMPLMSTKRDPQVVYASSAPHEDSDILRALIKRGRAGGEARLAHLEWADLLERNCATEGCTHFYGSAGCCLDDIERILAANPSLAMTADEAAAGRRITMAYIEGERRSLPPPEYARERLGWGDEPDDAPAIPIEGWVDVACEGKVVDGPALAVDMSPRRDFTSLVLAGKDRDGEIRGDLLEYGAGTSWAPVRIVRELETRGLDGIYLVKGGQAESLTPAILEAGYEVWPIQLADYGLACGSVYDLAINGKLRHAGRVELNTAVEGARLRDNGESTWVWSRRKSATDISPLVGLTAALHGHLTSPEDSVVISLADLDDEEDTTE